MVPHFSRLLRFHPHSSTKDLQRDTEGDLWKGDTEGEVRGRQTRTGRGTESTVKQREMRFREAR